MFIMMGSHDLLGLVGVGRRHKVAATTAAHRVDSRLAVRGVVEVLQVLLGGHGVQLRDGVHVSGAAAAGSEGLVGRGKVQNRGLEGGHGLESNELGGVGAVLGGDLGRGLEVAVSATSVESHV